MITGCTDALAAVHCRFVLTAFYSVQFLPRSRTHITTCLLRPPPFTDGMVVCHLPYGPTAYFGVFNTVLRHDIGQKKEVGQHKSRRGDGGDRILELREWLPVLPTGRHKQFEGSFWPPDWD